MGWLYFYKPKGQKALETIKQQMGAEWCEKHFVTGSATWDGVHIVAKFHEPESKVYVPDADGTIRAILVFMIKNVPNASDGYNFGYKDLEEGMGPYGTECAPSIIAAASPLQPKPEPGNDYSSLRSAHEYRERSLAKSKAKSAKRCLKAGARVKLPAPLSFGGIALDEFVVTKCRVRGRKGMSTVFRSVANGGLYALRAEQIVNATITT